MKEKINNFWKKNKNLVIFLIVLILVFHAVFQYFFGGMWDNKYDVSLSSAIHPTVTVEGKTYELLLCFEDPEQALEDFKKAMPRFITNVMRFTGADDLKATNISEFGYYVDTYREALGLGHNFEFDRWGNLVRYVCDAYSDFKTVYENSAKNKVVLDYVSDCEELGVIPKGQVILDLIDDK